MHIEMFQFSLGLWDDWMCLGLNITAARYQTMATHWDLSPHCRLSDLEASGLLDQCIRPQWGDLWPSGPVAQWL